MAQKFEISEISSLLNERGYFLEENFIYKNCLTPMTMLDKEGYKYSLSFDCFKTIVLRGCGKPDRIAKSNPFSLDNIKHWIKLEERPYSLECNGFVSSVEKNIHLKCSVCNNEWDSCWNYIQTNRGCPTCSTRRRGLKRRLSLESVLSGFSKVNAKIVNPEEYISTEIPVQTQCLICGNIWSTSYHHIRREQSCPRCKMSHGERRVNDYLLSKNVVFTPQKKFSKCRYKKKLPFDFYLDEYNICVEYHGEQHYRPYSYFGGESDFEEGQIRDKIKEDFCKNNNIKLIIIPYWEYQNIEIIMDHIL